GECWVIHVLTVEHEVVRTSPSAIHRKTLTYRRRCPPRSRLAGCQPSDARCGEKYVINATVRRDWQFSEATAVEARAYLCGARIYRRGALVENGNRFTQPRLPDCIGSDALSHSARDCGLP